MLSIVKKLLFSIFEYLSSLCLRLHARVKLGRRCHILGRPNIVLVSGSKLIIDDDVTLCSHPRFNPLLRERVNIRTLSADAHVELAHHVGISGSRIVCCNSVHIGAYTIIGPDTLIYDSEGHDYDAKIGWSGRSRRTGRAITIGERCFIGARCIILSGVSVGDQCVIAAGTVLTSDVPSGHIASGNPASIKPLPKILGGMGKKKHSSSVETSH